MSLSSKITFLGTGTSTGVPVIGCPCDVCHSTDQRNKRTRSSLLIESPTTNVIIDTGPDLREQALRESLSKADAILYTHGHADHTAGFDDIRAFCWKRDQRLPIYGSADTIEILTRMFPWAFNPKSTERGYVRADAKEFGISSFQIGDLKITPISVVHASIDTHGFLIELPSGKSFFYASDIKSLDDCYQSALSACDLHVLDGLRLTPHPSHLSVREAVTLSEKLKSPLTYLTHISHDVQYRSVSAILPPQIHLAYDGLQLCL